MQEARKLSDPKILSTRVGGNGPAKGARFLRSKTEDIIAASNKQIIKSG